ncbi:MAG: DUF4240 domain-containing protein [Myxococcales bacterium]|nr:DUF4240 domain-containing protein [Myxococcales bacterium]
MARLSSLDQTLRRARPGATIQVRAGVHRWSYSPEFAIKLVGAGAQSTRLELPARVSVSEELTLEGLTLIANEMALEIVGGRLSLTEVFIESVGSALFVHSGGRASVRHAAFDARRDAVELPIIEVRDEGSRLSLSHCSQRGHLGLFVHERAKVHAEETHFRAAAGPCLRAHGASMELERCTVEDAREAALYARDSQIALRGCSLRRGTYPQIEARQSFVRMVGGDVEAGEDDGVNAHEGSTIELESVRFSGNDIAVRVFDSRASLRDVMITDGRGAAVIAQHGAEIEVLGGEIVASEAAALEALDGGRIVARGSICRNAEGEPVLAYDGGSVIVEPGARSSLPLDAQRCWELIAEARASVRGIDDDLDAATARRLVEVLAQTDIPTIVAFHQFVRERMAEAYRWDLWAVAYIMNGGCSNDGFDYFIGWLVGQGRERFSASLSYPELAAAGYGPDDEPFTNETMLGVGSMAYRRLTGATTSADFYVAYTCPVPRKIAGVPFDENTVYRDHPDLGRFYE